MDDQTLVYTSVTVAGTLNLNSLVSLSATVLTVESTGVLNLLYGYVPPTSISNVGSYVWSPLFSSNVTLTVSGSFTVKSGGVINARGLTISAQSISISEAVASPPMSVMSGGSELDMSTCEGYGTLQLAFCRAAVARCDARGAANRPAAASVRNIFGSGRALIGLGRWSA